MKKRFEFNKPLLIIAIILLIVSIILLFLNNGISKDYQDLKINKSKNYVYTKYKNTSNEAYVPKINVKINNIDSINAEIEQLTKSYLTSTNSLKTVTYRYNLWQDYLSVVLMFRDENSSNELTYSFKTYVISLKEERVLSDSEAMEVFNISSDTVGKKLASLMYGKYLDEIDKGYFTKSECDFKCYITNREITSYLDGNNYYIENAKLVVYKSFNAYGKFHEENYFTRDDFKFYIN